MTLRIADSFTASLSKLAAQEQKAAKTAAFDLQMTPDTPGLSLHRVDRARDPDFWTARVNRDLRLVLHKRGGDTLLAFVGHHDDAYRWAERRRIDVHPRTGAAQIVEIRETVEDVVIRRYVEEAARKPRLFADEGDDALLSWGVPEDWLDTVRDATEDTVLEIAERLPAEAGEALLQAATGERPVPAPAGGDPYAHPDASRRFRVMENEAELAAALEAPWEKWSVFLHPAQREFVDRDFNGPARVIGSAGTGKTVVALHRAVRLAREDPSARVLLTTFNESLVDSLRQKVRVLEGAGEVADRISVKTLTSFAIEALAEINAGVDIAGPDTIADALDEAASAAGDTTDRAFLKAEWEQIVDAWSVPDAAAYRDMPRLGRKVRMAAGRRDALWSVFADARARLTDAGLMTPAQIMHAVAARYRGGAAAPFSHVVVDEAQDISVPELHLLASIAGDRPNGLFFAGDIGQRIFRRPFPWKAAGVDIQGRSRSLKVNYRTSQQIRGMSDRLLPQTITEADGTVDRRTGVVSLFGGPAPDLHAYADPDAEVEAVSAWLRQLLEEGLSAREIAIFVRSQAELPRAHAAAEAAELDVLDPKTGGRQDRSAATICTMHDAKGTEYRAVAVIACDEDVLPSEARLLAASDAGVIDIIMETERHLLYVAATRARERLWISGAGCISEFLDDLI